MGRAIVRKPRAFLFDEPLSNLDAKLRVQMREELSRLHKRLETTIVYVTHDQLEATTMADRIIFQLQDLTKHYGQTEVLKGITLAFLEGAKIGVIGPNGAGKSTLLSIIAGEDTKFEGVAKGIAAPEAGNNAAAGGALVPMLTLGVPGSGTTAVLLALLMTLNITPGPTLFTENPEVVWGLIASLLIANFVLLVMNVPMVKIFVRVLQVPPWVLMPGVTMISFVGIYSLSGSYFDLLLMVGFGVLGYIMRKLDIPTVPVILGILLGGHMETALRRAMLMNRPILSARDPMACTPTTSLSLTMTRKYPLFSFFSKMSSSPSSHMVAWVVLPKHAACVSKKWILAKAYAPGYTVFSPIILSAATMA